MDYSSVQAILAPPRDIYQLVFERIAWQLDQPSLRRSHTKALEDLAAQVRRVWLGDQHLRRTFEYNEELLKGHKLAGSHAVLALEEYAKATGDTMRSIEAYLTDNSPGASAKRSFFRRVSVTLNPSEEVSALVAFIEQLRECANGMDVGLCCLNLWLDVEQGATARVIGCSLAALEKHVKIFTAPSALERTSSVSTGDLPGIAVARTALLAMASETLYDVQDTYPSAADLAETRPQVAEPYWRTHVFHASYSGDPEGVITALRLGVNSNTRGPEGFTLLHVAAELNNIGLVRLLLELGADTTVIAQGQLPILLATLKSHADIVKFLLDSRVDVNCISPDAANTVLFAACSTGNFELVKYFVLEKGAELSIPNCDGDTPLSKASAMGHGDIVEFLLDRGAPQVANNEGAFPIHLAAVHDRREILTALLQRDIDPNTLSAKGRTPILLAAATGQTATIRILVRHGGNVNLPDVHGQTPLYMAVYQGHTETVKKLLELEADLSIAMEDNITPIQLAAAKGFAKIVKILLDRGADPSLPGVNDVTPLIDACFGNYYDVVKMLLDAGAEVNSRDRAGWTAAAKAATNVNIDILKALVEKGADLSISDNNGFTPLHKAASLGHTEMVTYLVEQPGVDFHTRSASGLTALYAAAAEGHAETVEVLLDAGAIHTDTFEGMTPLHIAAREGHTEVVKTLLRRGADASALNGEGVTPAEWARRFEYEETAALIEQRK
ncbi:ankyrin repeat-containing domain protein [Aspergillus keveii]|uniref:Ankyrin repeat-containing domain protein n=1 Tax=Aspergillus keveii TaxID=714993 RepID=A0ABR4FMN6_9EURO